LVLRLSIVAVRAAEVVAINLATTSAAY